MLDIGSMGFAPLLLDGASLNIPTPIAIVLFVGGILVEGKLTLQTDPIQWVSQGSPTIKDIHARGTTIVWIEHIVHALVSVASRLIVMNFGQILAQGNPHDVMAEAKVREVYMGMPVS